MRQPLMYYYSITYLYMQYTIPNKIATGILMIHNKLRMDINKLISRKTPKLQMVTRSRLTTTHMQMYAIINIISATIKYHIFYNLKSASLGGCIWLINLTI